MRYKAVFHVDQKDEQILQLALNNVTNLLNAIPGQEHDLVVLLNGPAVALMAGVAAASIGEQVRGLAAQVSGMKWRLRRPVCRNL